MNYKLLSIILAVPALLAACSDDGQQGNGNPDGAPVSCASETRDEEYVAGLEKVGASGTKVILVESTPAPPAKGNNTWRLRVLDSADTPLDGLTVELVPFMPDHNHGTPINAEVTALAEPGEYQAEPVNLWMPGLWEVTVQVSDGADLSDSVIYRFCIEG